MATLVSFHAHPDDEAIATGGTIAMAAEAGHRVVIVFATRGEHGEVDDGFLDPGETLAERRTKECHEAAARLGAHRVAFLDYDDSGMVGTPENDLPGSFWSAPVDEAAARLAAILDEEAATVLTTYDAGGVYGHPDHVQVHRVGARAAELAGTPQVFENTMNRDHLREVMQAAIASGALPAEEVPEVGPESTFGQPQSVITTRVEIHEPHLSAKRAAMAAHASQISETSFFLSMPEEAFAATFGIEWYIRPGVAGGAPVDDFFAVLEG